MAKENAVDDELIKEVKYDMPTPKGALRPMLIGGQNGSQIRPPMIGGFVFVLTDLIGQQIANRFVEDIHC